MLLILEEEKSCQMNIILGGVKLEKPAELSKLEEMLVSKLNEVKDIMDSQRDTLAVSIRRDVVAVQLKDMLEENTSFYSLKSALEDYIKDLYSTVEIKEEDANGDENNNKE